MLRPPPSPTLFPYTTLFRSCRRSAPPSYPSISPHDPPPRLLSPSPRPRRRPLAASRAPPPPSPTRRAAPRPAAESAQAACQPPGGPDSGPDLNPARPGPLRLRDPHRQHPLVQRCLDLVRVKVTRQRHSVLEPAGAPRATPKHTLTLALPDLAADLQLRVGELNLDVLLPDPGQVGLDQPGILGLLDIHQRRPDGVGGIASPGALPQLVHALLQIGQFTERVPRLACLWSRSTTANGKWHVPSLSLGCSSIPGPTITGVIAVGGPSMERTGLSQQRVRKTPTRPKSASPKPFLSQWRPGAGSRHPSVKLARSRPAVNGA